MNTSVRPVGQVEILVEHSDGRREETTVHNAVLQRGRYALASCLANNVSPQGFDFFIQNMLFGDGGATGGTPGVPKYVNSEREGLFGAVRASKPVIAVIDPNMPSQVVFTSVLTFGDANGFAINEMALQMSNGDLYSMATSPGFGKTSTMQVTFNWRISFV
jgi:hypothetical protein